MNLDLLLELLPKLGVEKVRTHERSGNLQISCPLARWTHASGADNNPSCSIKIAPNDVSLFRCWACQERGTLVGLVAQLNRYRAGELEDLLKEVARVEQLDLTTQVERAAKKYEPEAPKIAEQIRRIDFDVWSEGEIADWVGKVPKYALDRGISIETSREWQLGFDRKGKRLIFPVRRADGKLVGVTGRAIYENLAPKYKDYWGFEKSKYLYGENRIDPALGKLIVVEGFMDVLKLWTQGHRNVVATMGASASAEQLRKIRDLGLDVYMMQDGDRAGRTAREIFVSRLHGRVRLFDVPIPDDGDPDEMAPEDVSAALGAAALVLARR